MENRNSHLDFARGAAAIAVVLGHCRASVFQDPAAVPNAGAWERLFYTVTHFQYEAVMIFFVLSGFLVGGSVLRDLSKERWSWSRYATQRLTRLWVVLIPALLLTSLWDYIGLAIGDRPYYRGARDHVAAFLGNLFFLQKITSPVYGSNGPLWSLSYEFWYYLLFPMIGASFFPGFSRRTKRILLGVAIGLLAVLPRSLAAGGLVWLMGAGAALCITHPALLRWTANLPFFLLSVALFLWTLATPGLASFPWPNLPLGLTFACMIPFLATHPGGGSIYQGFARGISNISYTLYLVHFPAMIFVFFGLRYPYQRPLNADTLVFFAGLLLVIGIYALVIWYLFERRTDQVRAWVYTRVLPFWGRRITQWVNDFRSSRSAKK